jgi:antitoxin component of MazEF toxin-antitoxin module
MITRLRKVGRNRAVLLDPTLMELIGLEENALVQLTVHRGSLVVTPVNPSAVTPEQFEAAMRRVMKRWKGALKRLAD